MRRSKVVEHRVGLRRQAPGVRLGRHDDIAKESNSWLNSSTHDVLMQIRRARKGRTTDPTISRSAEPLLARRARPSTRLAFGMLALVIAGFLSPAHGLAAITTGYQPEAGFALAPGAEYERGSVTVNGDNRRDINIVKFEPGASQIQLRVSQADGIAANRATVVKQAAAYSRDGRRVVATVNGSLFNYLAQDGSTLGGTGLGLNVSDGELINAGNTTPRPELPAFGVNAAQTPIIGTPRVDLTLNLAGNEVVPLDRINQRRFSGEVALYTPYFGSKTWTDNLGTEFVIEGFDLPLAVTGTYSGTVVQVRQGDGNSTIGRGQVVLSQSNTAAPWSTKLSVGSAVSLTVAVDEAWQSVKHSVGGRDMLVVGGQSVVPQPDDDGSHARSAVGIKANGKLMLVTADNGTYSKGMTLTDLAELMISLGAVRAMNLDGGGSSQMAVRLPGDTSVSMVNTSGTQTDRPVVNALQVVSLAPTGELDRLILTPEQATGIVGQPKEFTAKGQDAALNGVDLDPSTLEWSVVHADGGGTAFAVDGLRVSVTPNRSGDHMVTVRKGGINASARLTVASGASVPVVSVGDATLLDTGTAALDSASVGVEWTASDDVGVTAVEVQRRLDSGIWKSAGLSQGASMASLQVGFGRRVQFRVRAFDGSGNSSAWALTVPVRLVLYDDKNQALKSVGAWVRKPAADAIGGQFLRSRVAGASLSLTFIGMQVAAVGNRGPDGGRADVYLGGNPVSSVSLDASAMRFRRILYLSAALTPTTPMTIRLVNTSSATRPVFDFDAFLVLAPDS